MHAVHAVSLAGTGRALLGTVRPLGLLIVAFFLGACAVHEDATEVFVQDPHKVWVEAWTSQGTRVLLPAGQSFSEVMVHADIPPNPYGPSYATLAREANGGITLDYAGCAPYPTSPLSAEGELTVVRAHGEERVRSDGRYLHVPFKCGDDEYTTLDLSFVTPLSNVREVHIVHHTEEGPIVEASSHPALQEQEWAR